MWPLFHRCASSCLIRLIFNFEVFVGSVTLAALATLLIWFLRCSAEALQGRYWTQNPEADTAGDDKKST